MNLLRNLRLNEVKRANRKRLLFFAMPKCGSSSLARVATRYDIEVHWHNKRQANFTELYDRTDLYDRFIFTTIRHPVERVYSAWRYLTTGGNCEDDAIDARKYLVEHESFDDFIARSLKDERPEIFEQLHFRPMAEWITNNDGEILVDSIFDISQSGFVAKNFIPGFIGCSPIDRAYEIINVSTTKKKTISKGTVELVHQAYKIDFDTFGCWHQ